MIELNPNFKSPNEAGLLRLIPDGSKESALRGKLTLKDKWQRYTYSAFNFFISAPAWSLRNFLRGPNHYSSQRC